MEALVSTGVGEYLEAIYKLSEGGAPASVPALAEHVGVTPVSANEMVRKLSERDLAVYEPYKGVSLTDEGRRQALLVIRRHRLWERFLTDFLKMPWDEVHEEACRLEHVTSSSLEAKLAEFLASPESCPHGHAVPTADGTLVDDGVCTNIAEMLPGQTGIVVSVPEEDPALLRYFDTLGMRPAARFTVISKEPFDGPITVRVGGPSRPIARALAARISVRVQEEDNA